MGGALLKLRRASDVERHGLDHVQTSGFWDLPSEREPRIHRIHPYPAKFPAFLTSKAIGYAQERGLSVKRVGDVFCGCGTVALEARREGVDFWGCDINPVATLIARAKSARIRPTTFRDRASRIVQAYKSSPATLHLGPAAQSRLKHWYSPQQIEELARLLNAIRSNIDVRSSHRDPFLCAFSAILKKASQWRQRAIKPHFDDAKCPGIPLELFREQCEFMAAAWDEVGRSGPTHQQILTANVLTVDAPKTLLDLIVTSPPYVTSYEYADLHQLSAIWLGFADDYRKLRTGSIGSTQHELNFSIAFKHLNEVGMRVVFGLYDRDRRAAQAVANYYLDMQKVAKRTCELLQARGLAMFVIGNTRYKGVLIDNAAHLSASLLANGFSSVEVAKRRIGNKCHTPYRSDDGKFSPVATENCTYAEEFILFASK